MLHRSDFFYADDGLVASTKPVWLQVVFGTLTGLLDRVGFWTNIKNTFGILYRPFCVMGTHSKAAYGRQMIWEGLTYRAR